MIEPSPCLLVGSIVVPIGKIGNWGDIITTGISEFFFETIDVKPGDMKITIQLSGLPSQKTTFYFRDNEIKWFEVDNVEGLHK